MSTESLQVDILLKELKNELCEIEKLKTDHEEKKRLGGNESFNSGAIIALENASNHIKRAVARAMFPIEVRNLKKWIGILCEARNNNNHTTYDAVAEQVIYEMFYDRVIGGKNGEKI